MLTYTEQGATHSLGDVSLLFYGADLRFKAVMCPRHTLLPNSFLGSEPVYDTVWTNGLSDDPATHTLLRQAFRDLAAAPRHPQTSLQGLDTCEYSGQLDVLRF